MIETSVPPMPFDGARAESLVEMTALDGVAFDDLGCAAAVWSPPPGAALALRVSTSATLRLDVAEAMVVGVVRRLPRLEARAMDMRCALQEAIGNAVVHGNLGLDSTLRGTMAGLREFSRVMEQRRNDPALAARPVTLWAVAREDGVEIAVEDVGNGFTPGPIVLTEGAGLTAGGGLGLGIIGRCCSAVRFEQGGRRIVMTFSYS